jgi:sugar phosphate isomerase/epimerase
VVLSSYIQVAPEKTTGENFATEMDVLIKRVQRFGFQKVRLFPGSGVSPEDESAIVIVAKRIVQIAREIPDVQVLLETHDGSIADRPEAIVKLVEQIDLPNVALLYQPTEFQAEPALKQLAVQKHLVRHVHLQNRNADRSYTTLKKGVVPWNKILPQLKVDATLEFVPSGICPVEKFDLEKSLAETVTEAEYAASISS